ASLCFFLCSHSDLLHLHSFPTRRSSDLQLVGGHINYQLSEWQFRLGYTHLELGYDIKGDFGDLLDMLEASGNPVLTGIANNATRSEEHTSELQSRENLVCRLLLEKKKSN